MYTLIVQNKYGEQLELTHNPAYAVTSIDGIDPPEATVNTTRNANYDGSVYNSSYINERQITVTLAINGPAEANRIKLYQYFKSKMPVRIFYKNNARNVYIDGYVQNMPIGFFEKKETVQITIICPQPKFNGKNENIQEFSSVNPLFEFPFSIPENGIPFSGIILAQEKSIINRGDLETGVIINIHALGTIINPKIYNVETLEHIYLNTTLQEGDDITINTRQGEKAVSLTRDGVTTNLISAFGYGSSWFQLVPGDNVFTVAADAGIEYFYATFTMVDQYEGV